jgi:hypothetical protein
MNNEKGTVQPKVYNLFMVPPAFQGTERLRSERCFDTPSHVQNGFSNSDAKPTCGSHALSRGSQQSAKNAKVGKYGAIVDMDLKNEAYVDL